MHIRLKYTLVAVLVTFSMANTTVYADVLALKAGHIVNPETGVIEANKIIIVDGTKIKSIEDIMPKSGIDRVIDLSDKWVLPGLMDMHMHITYNQANNIPRERADYAIQPIRNTAGYRALVGMHNAQDMLHAGFTTIRDVGNNGNYADSDLVKAMHHGLFKGPRIVNSGKIISVYGAQSHGISHEVGAPWQFEYIEADSVDEIIKAIRKNIFYGAQLIKIVVGDQQYEYSLEDMKLIVAEAKKMNMTVAAHAYGDRQVRNAALAGVTSIEHGDDNVSADVFKVLAKQGTILVGTDFPVEHMMAMTGGGKKWPDAIIQGYNEEQANKILSAKREGVLMAFGTDVMSDMPEKNRADMVLEYLDVYVRVGLKPMEILKMMTANGAKVIGKDKSLGKISKGYLADIIAVSEDPSINIMALKDVNFVMRDGDIIEQSE